MHSECTETTLRPTAGGEEPDRGSAAVGPELTRREFLANLLVAFSFLGTAAAVINALVRYLSPPAKGIGGAGEPVEVGSVAQVPDGASKDFMYQDAPYVLVNSGGQFAALSKKCTHLGCLVEWSKDEGHLLCPCHAAVFDTNGKVVSGPAPKPLPTLKVQVSGDKIYVGA